ncbi:MAG: hypothetical protein R3C70_16730 [Geminicoccaceae bacterium]
MSDKIWCVAKPDHSEVARRNAIEINPKNGAPQDEEAIIVNKDGTVTIGKQLTGTADKFWPIGAVLRVAFINGSEMEQDRVMKIAARWSDHANVQFDRVDDSNDPAPDIRIKFDTSSHSSQIGTDSRLKTEAGDFSMEFSDFAPPEDVVLHEFGHALGLNHEHQNPEAGIDWNKAEVFADLGGPPNNWSKNTIEFNIFAQLTDNSLNYSDFDSVSIMGYNIKSSWTNDGFSVTRGTDLSPMDISFISDWYPFGGATRPSRRSGTHKILALTRGISKRLFRKSWDADVWRPESNWDLSLEGQITGHPAPVQFHTDVRMTVVARRALDGAPVSIDNPFDQFGVWSSLGGEITGSPTVLATNTFVWCFVRGISGRPFFKRRRNGEWDRTTSGWTTLGGKITGGISATHTGEMVALAVRGFSSGEVFIKWWDGIRWQPDDEDWVGIGGNVTAMPSIAWSGTNLHVVIRLAGGEIRHLIYDTKHNRIAQNWTSVDGRIIGSPILVAGLRGHVHLLVRGISRQTFMRTFADNKWSTVWENLGGQALDSPVAIQLPLDSQAGPELHVFITGTSRAGFHKFWNGKVWSPASDWHRLGGHVDWGL